MNDILINSSIAFGLLFVLIVPLYIASKASAQNRSSELRSRCIQLLSEKRLIPLQQEIIGNKVFVFSEGEKVLILSRTTSVEEYLLLEKASIYSFITQEISTGGTLAEIRFCYEEAGIRKEFLLYKQHRESVMDIAKLREIGNQIKKFLS